MGHNEDSKLQVDANLTQFVIAIQNNQQQTREHELIRIHAMRAEPRH